MIDRTTQMNSFVFHYTATIAMTS
ncbi:hypothetical protein DSM3645_02898 [Blastopirellula marina DSM 3645]|uniref:Uncharacterized protein n=1 Tax=Blastopirellula marina DSM 3645 TaxID=314230 RepID=A3ZVP3_9BACT|nr:hypothetical protein DSM3645_02898 [Blastopirellula marina DSM 3645]